MFQPKFQYFVFILCVVFSSSFIEGKLHGLKKAAARAREPKIPILPVPVELPPIINPRRGIDLNQYLQPNDIGVNEFYDFLPDDGRRCARNCHAHPEPRICYYKFTIEQYHSLGPACGDCPRKFADCFRRQCVTAAGVEKSLLTVNRMLPSSPIHVCFNDRIVVDIKNVMPARSLSIHWHGMWMQNTPYMDGASYVTQCPIAPGQVFRYDFPANTKGTHWYHSHESFQIIDGLAGPMVVHAPVGLDFNNRPLYDYDLYSHTIYVQDWFSSSLADNRYPGYNKNRLFAGFIPDTYLINGLGNVSPLLDFGSINSTLVPHAVFRVRHGKRYRFRVVGGLSATCAARFTIQHHALTLIEVDGYSVKPVIVRSIDMDAGDTYDFVIHATERISAYWIRVQGLGICSAASQTAVLIYDGSPTQIPQVSPFRQAPSVTRFPSLNDVDRGCSFPPNNTINLCHEHLESAEPYPLEILKPEPDYAFVLNSSEHMFSNGDLFGTNDYHKFFLPNGGPELGGGAITVSYNGFSYMDTPFAIMSDNYSPEHLEKMLCPNLPKCPKKVCECVHLIRIPLNKVVQFTFIDGTSTNNVHMRHPQHLHGFGFQIIRQGSKQDLQRTNLLNPTYRPIRPNHLPIQKSTITIPPQGFAVMRFLSWNPGYWLMHCHFALHNFGGMMAVVQVGHPGDWPPPPPTFPRCNDFKPPVY